MKKIEGKVNGITANGVIWGWALNPKDLEEEIELQIQTGKTIRTIIAREFRRDLQNKYAENPNHAFRIQIEGSTLAPGDQITIREKETQEKIRGGTIQASEVLSILARSEKMKRHKIEANRYYRIEFKDRGKDHNEIIGGTLTLEIDSSLYQIKSSSSKAIKSLEVDDIYNTEHPFIRVERKSTNYETEEITPVTEHLTVFSTLSSSNEVNNTPVEQIQFLQPASPPFIRYSERHPKPLQAQSSTKIEFSDLDLDLELEREIAPHDAHRKLKIAIVAPKSISITIQNSFGREADCFRTNGSSKDMLRRIDCALVVEGLALSHELQEFLNQCIKQSIPIASVSIDMEKNVPSINAVKLEDFSHWNSHETSSKTFNLLSAMMNHPYIILSDHAIRARNQKNTYLFDGWYDLPTANDEIKHSNLSEENILCFDSKFDVSNFRANSVNDLRRNFLGTVTSKCGSGTFAKYIQNCIISFCKPASGASVSIQKFIETCCSGGIPTILYNKKDEVNDLTKVLDICVSEIDSNRKMSALRCTCNECTPLKIFIAQRVAQHYWSNFRSAKILEKLSHYSQKFDSREIYESRTKVCIAAITVTKRPELIDNVLSNIQRQDVRPVEHHIVLHGDFDDSVKSKISDKVSEDAFSCLHFASQRQTIGQCLELASKYIKADYIAKFDDDDFYSNTYISDSLAQISKFRPAVYSQPISLVFSESRSKLFFVTENIPNYFVIIPSSQYKNFLGSGGTLIFRRDIAETIGFSQSRRVGEDSDFCNRASASGFDIMIGSSMNYVHFRGSILRDHSWEFPLEAGSESFVCVGSGSCSAESYLDFVSRFSGCSVS